MGSPHKPNKSIIASTISPQSAAFQGTSVFSGLTSPPLVFTSPRINTHRQSEFKNSENAPRKVTDSMNPEGSMESNMLVDQGHPGNLPEPVENDGCLQSNICQSNVSRDHIAVQEYDQQVVQVGQSQLGKRRRLEFEDKLVENETNSQNSANPTATSAVLESSFSQNFRNSVSKPSGIGLHLNSIVNSMPLIYPIGGKKKLISITPSVSTNTNSVENVSVKSDAKSVEMINYQDSLDQGSMNSQLFERIDDFEKPVPKKKRKKKTENTGDGCKNCTCKKSKCLKLYCDCFAAGIYCSGSCCCEGCFNRPEYEETVLETRKQIESRNPIAFAPKIVQRITQSPTIQTKEGGDQVTPVAAKHKRGCSCRKSMCLKKYCECYQANVGCSDGCRCEGCQNIYGAKSVRGVFRETRMEAINEELVDNKLKVGPIRSKSEFHKPHTLTPQTPSLQCSNQGKDAAKALVFPGKYVLSPESECTFYPHYINTQTPPKDSSITEPNNTTHETQPYDHGSYPMNEFTDEFSPGDWSKSNTSRSQLLPFCFRGSSVTPVTLFGGTKPSFDMIDDDDTPNLLRESCFIQPNKVIDRSPNKKRISPPRIRLHEMGSTSLKSGRKFILKSVPSIPPGDNTH